MIPTSSSSEGWVRKAACGAHSEPEIFTQEQYRVNDPALAEARSVCRTCPVRRECYDFGYGQKATLGIWGGFTFTQLRNRRERLALARREAA